MISRKADV